MHACVTTLYAVLLLFLPLLLCEMKIMTNGDHFHNLHFSCFLQKMAAPIWVGGRAQSESLIFFFFFFYFRPSRSSSDAGLAVHQGIYQVIYIPSSTILGCTLIGVRCTSWAPALTCKQLTPYVHAPRCSATFLKWKSDFYAVMIRLACTIHCLLAYLLTYILHNYVSWVFVSSTIVHHTLLYWLCF